MIFILAILLFAFFLASVLAEMSYDLVLDRRGYRCPKTMRNVRLGLGIPMVVIVVWMFAIILGL